MKAANPYLNFAGNTEEAFDFYRSVIGGEFIAVVRFRDFGGDSPGLEPNELDRIAHIALPLGSNVLMGTDILESRGDRLSAGNNVYIALEADSPDEAKSIFTGLAAGGRTEMDLGRTEWAELYGICIDRFGVQWMVSYTGNVSFGGGGQG